MLIDTPLVAQLRAQENDRIRVLVVGAGVAGITLTQLLRQHGLHPVLVDRMTDGAHPGYMLALMPLVDQAFVDLGVQELYRSRSTPIERYGVRSHRGRVLRQDSVDELLSVYGDYNGISRGELIEVLTGGGCPVAFGTTVGSVETSTPTGPAGTSGTRVRFIDRDGADTGDAAFDLVIGADGIRSRMRTVLGASEPDVVDTGWSGWVAWADDLGDPGLVEEVWGDGFFLGVYPVKDRLGVFLGGPDAELAAGPAAFVGAVRARVEELGPRLEASIDAVLEDPDPYLWRLGDVRAAQWVLPGGALLGDAATGFLPTAGIGAGMATESAWMLGRMLRGAERDELPEVLAAWERVERPRVEAAQKNSRMLATLMFRSGRPLAWLRESMTRLLSVRAVLRPILRLLAERPEPDVVRRPRR